MDVRTANRIAQIEHIRSKPYYSPLVEEPDPLLDKTVSTRMWKHVKLWIETLEEEEALQERAATRRSRRDDGRLPMTCVYVAQDDEKSAVSTRTLAQRHARARVWHACTRIFCGIGSCDGSAR